MDRRVERLQRRSVAQPGVLSLAGGLPASGTFPLSALARAFGALDRNSLQYDWPEGRPGLRNWIAERLARRGVTVSPDHVLITSGAQQALDIAVRLSLRDGHRFRVPDACYPGALELFSGYGCELVRSGEAADLEYVMPAVNNPCGLALSPAARALLLDGEHWLLEDDAYAELRFDGEQLQPLLAVAPERVLHVGTLSKTLCPGVRIGWLVVPGRLQEAARRAKQRTDLQGNTLAQSIVERYLEHEDFDERLAWLRAYYTRHADALMSALQRRIPSISFDAPQGGFSLWARTEEPWDDVEFLKIAMERGTSFDPGRDFQRPGEGGPLCMRLAFSSLPVGEIDEAVKRLARAFHDFGGLTRTTPQRVAAHS